MRIGHRIEDVQVIEGLLGRTGEPLIVLRVLIGDGDATDLDRGRGAGGGRVQGNRVRIARRERLGREQSAVFVHDDPRERRKSRHVADLEGPALEGDRHVLHVAERVEGRLGPGDLEVGARELRRRHAAEHEIVGRVRAQAQDVTGRISARLGVREVDVVGQGHRLPGTGARGGRRNLHRVAHVALGHDGEIVAVLLELVLARSAFEEVAIARSRERLARVEIVGNAHLTLGRNDVVLEPGRQLAEPGGIAEEGIGLFGVDRIGVGVDGAAAAADQGVIAAVADQHGIAARVVFQVVVPLAADQDGVDRLRRRRCRGCRR